MHRLFDEIVNCRIFDVFPDAMHFQECPVGTYKDVEGSDASLCTPCSVEYLPSRASFVYVRGMFVLQV